MFVLMFAWMLACAWMHAWMHACMYMHACLHAYVHVYGMQSMTPETKTNTPICQQSQPPPPPPPPHYTIRAAELSCCRK